MSDNIAFLRERQQRIQKEREAAIIEQRKIEAVQIEQNNAWRAVITACLNYGIKPKDQIPFEPFKELAGVLKRHGFDAWLPDLSQKAKENIEINDLRANWAARLFFVELMIAATDASTNSKTFNKLIHSYLPPWAPDWLSTAAHDVCEIIAVRKDEQYREQVKQQIEQLARAEQERADSLRVAAARRPAIEKQLFAVFYADQGHGPAAIRDLWKAKRPREPIETGEAGRNDIKTNLRRGREFLAENATDTMEMMVILGFSFAS